MRPSPPRRGEDGQAQSLVPYGPVAAGCPDNRWLPGIRPELEPLRAPWPEAAHSATPLDEAEWPLSPPAPRSAAAWRARPWAAAGATRRCGPALRCPPG